MNRNEAWGFNIVHVSTYRCLLNIHELRERRFIESTCKQRHLLFINWKIMKCSTVDRRKKNCFNMTDSAPHLNELIFSINIRWLNHRHMNRWRYTLSTLPNSKLSVACFSLSHTQILYEKSPTSVLVVPESMPKYVEILIIRFYRWQPLGQSTSFLSIYSQNPDES